LFYLLLLRGVFSFFAKFPHESDLALNKKKNVLMDKTSPGIGLEIKVTLTLIVAHSKNTAPVRRPTLQS
jgi:hypothetical protein